MNWKKIVSSVLLFLVCVETTIVLHELGHYTVAKACGVYCPAFTVGVGPSVTLGKTDETEWKLGLFPVMGGVSMVVRSPGEEVPTIDGVPINGRTLDQLSRLECMAVMGAGVVVNFVLGIGAFLLILRSAKPELRPDLWSTVRLVFDVLAMSAYYMIVSLLTFGRYPAQKIEMKPVKEGSSGVAVNPVGDKGQVIVVEKVEDSEEKEPKPLWLKALLTFAGINLSLGVFNLLPIVGLDGFWLFCSAFGIDVRTALSWVPDNFVTWVIVITIVHSVIFYLVPRKKTLVLVEEVQS